MSVVIAEETLREIHRQVIDASPHDEMDLREAVRDEGTLYYIATHTNDINEIFEQAAFLLFAIAHYHPFLEGNKRTAFLAAIVVLPRDIFADLDDTVIDEKIRHIASDEGTLEESRNWIEMCAGRI